MQREQNRRCNSQKRRTVTEIGKQQAKELSGRRKRSHTRGAYKRRRRTTSSRRDGEEGLRGESWLVRKDQVTRPKRLRQHPTLSWKGEQKESGLLLRERRYRKQRGLVSLTRGHQAQLKKNYFRREGANFCPKGDPLGGERRKVEGGREESAMNGAQGLKERVKQTEEDHEQKKEKNKTSQPRTVT